MFTENRPFPNHCLDLVDESRQCQTLSMDRLHNPVCDTCAYFVQLSCDFDLTWVRHALCASLNQDQHFFYFFLILPAVSEIHRRHKRMSGRADRHTNEHTTRFLPTKSRKHNSHQRSRSSCVHKNVSYNKTWRQKLTEGQLHKQPDAQIDDGEKVTTLDHHFVLR